MASLRAARDMSPPRPRNGQPPKALNEIAPADSPAMSGPFRIRRRRTITVFMLTRSLPVYAALLLVTLGCDDAKEKAKAAELQRQADDRIAKIQSEATEKV